MGKSRSRYSPVQALSCMPITCSKVDLPAPEGPMMETNSPSLIWTLMRRRTKVLVGPCSKYFSTLRSWIIEAGSKSFSQKFVDRRRIGLAAAGLHHLAYEEGYHGG